MKNAPHLMVACILIATSHAFTMMQMSDLESNSPHRRLSTHLSPRSSSVGFTTSATSMPRTSNKAIASGCADYSERSSLRSRVGLAVGQFKRRIRRRRPKVEVIEDVSDFDSILKSTKEQFVAVFFHSPVCKACQAAAPHYYKLSQKYNNVKFLSVPLTPGNKETLQQDMGVKKFPFGHIYHSQDGLLDELPILRKLIPDFEQRLQSHVIAGSAGVAMPEDVKTILREGNLDAVEEECTV